MATTVETKSTRGAELLGLVAFALALMLLIALATFDPRDPAPFFKAGVEGPRAQLHRPVRGVPGRDADPAAVRPRRRSCCRSSSACWAGSCSGASRSTPPTRRRSATASSCSPSPGCSALAVGDGELRGRAGAGRGRGRRAAVSGLLVADFSRTGAYILAATALFVALILSTQFSFSTFLQRHRRARSASACGRCRPPGPTTGRAAARSGCVATSSASTPRQDAGGGLPRIRKVKADGGSRRGRAAGRGRRRPAPARGAAAAWRRPRRRRCPSRSRPTDPEEDAPEAPRPRSAARRRKGRRASAPAAGGVAGGTTPCPRSRSSTRPRAGGAVDNDRLLEKGRILQSKCSEFGVMGTVKEIHPGPVVTTYEFKPDAGRQVLEDRRPRGRPRPRPRGRVDPRRPHQREGQRRHRDPERGARDDLPARDPRVGHLPPLLGPADPRRSARR